MDSRDTKDSFHEAVLAATHSGGRSTKALLELLYDELRSLARARVGRLPPGQTLQATALVHEVWMRMSNRENDDWEGRQQFLGAAAQAMRDILVEQARRKHSLKRGGGDRRDRVPESEVVDDFELEFSIQREDLLTLDGVLGEFETQYPRPAEVVMLRWFSGLSNLEVAGLLDVTERTVERDWRFAKAWLYEKMQDGTESSEEHRRLDE